MNPIMIVAVLAVLFFSFSAMAKKKESQKKPNTNKPPDDPLPSTQTKPPAGNVVGDIVKAGTAGVAIVGAIKGAIAGAGAGGASAGIGTGAGAGAGAGGAGAGAGGAGASGANALTAALPSAIPFLIGYAVAIAAYIFLRELTELGAKAKDFSKRIAMGARPSFGWLHGMEVAFLRDTLTAAKISFQETSTRDERFTTHYTQVTAQGYYTSIAKPPSIDLEEWKALNKLARKLAMSTLLFQSHICSRWLSNWTGISGMGGRVVRTIGELGFTGPGVARWADVDLNGPIPYDSIPTPGGFYFTWEAGCTQPGDEGLTRQAQMYGIVSACMMLKTDPTWYVVYNRDEYALRAYNLGGFAELGITKAFTFLDMKADRWAAKNDFTVELDKTVGGKMDGYEPQLNAQELFQPVITGGSAEATAANDIAVLYVKSPSNSFVGKKGVIPS